MVRLALALCARRYSSDFIDSLRIYVKGGTGGAGVMHLGGIGGRGGDVYVVGAKDKNMRLKDLKLQYPAKRFTADAGECSSRRALSGLQGRSIYIQIPHGITIVNAENGRKIGDINHAGDRVLVARGGRGGDRFSRFEARPGERRSLLLDLRLIADVGFVGFPNAGKSTLLNAISNAAPEVADYPFTTLRPHIGIVNYPDHRKISCADLPGLIEGAHINLGMGHKFLKHIQRTKLLLFVVDLFGFSLYVNQGLRDAFETVQLLTKELELYNKKLVSRPAMLVFNKIDKDGAGEKLRTAMAKLENWEKHVHTLPEDMIPQQQLNFSSVTSISAKHGTSVVEFEGKLREVLDQTAKNQELGKLPSGQGELDITPEDDPLSVHNRGRTLIV